ncbi:hypothetical protein GW17_00054332 [Ensete ventricosum]|nr:hypothetical protein GW17_00054332 [Ensete ventricosum]
MKKRVERSSDDPAVVVTTYEGQHTHPSPIVPCGAHYAPLCPLPLLPAESSMPPPLGFGISSSVNSNEFQFPLLRSYLDYSHYLSTGDCGCCICPISSSLFRTSYSCAYHRGSKTENSLHLLKGLELTIVNVKPHHPGYSFALWRGHLSRVSDLPTSLLSAPSSTSLFSALIKYFATPAPPTTSCCWASTSISLNCWFTAVDEQAHRCLLYCCLPVEAALAGSSRFAATRNCPSRTTAVSRSMQECFPRVQKSLLLSAILQPSIASLSLFWRHLTSLGDQKSFLLFLLQGLVLAMQTCCTQPSRSRNRKLQLLTSMINQNHPSETDEVQQVLGSGPSVVGARVRGLERRRGDRADATTTIVGTQVVAAAVARSRMWRESTEEVAALLCSFNNRRNIAPIALFRWLRSSDRGDNGYNYVGEEVHDKVRESGRSAPMTTDSRWPTVHSQ